MGKTWKDLQVGDTIYYYDHGRIHEQIIHDIKDYVDSREYKDWQGNTVKYENKYRDIIAGKNKRTNLRIWEYYLNRDNDIIYGMPRFSNKIVAENYIKNRINYCQRKIDYFDKKKEKYANMMKHYDL